MTQLLSLKKIKIPATPISKSNFKPYGQLITPVDDSKAFDVEDAILTLNNSTPRFYIMRLQYRGKTFSKITRHNLCTQCLGSINNCDWLIAVCPPATGLTPDIDQLKAFKIPGDCFIKLDVGTWHAGPYFSHDEVDFYNLELSDTNVVDHFTYNFSTQHNLEFEVVD